MDIINKEKESFPRDTSNFEYAIRKHIGGIPTEGIVVAFLERGLCMLRT